MSRDPPPRPVWEEKKIFSFPDRSGWIKVNIPIQTGLGRVRNFQLPRLVWEEYQNFSFPDQSGKGNKFSATQTGLGG